MHAVETIDTVSSSLKTAKRSVWVGAMSFEERCIGSLLALSAVEAKFDDVVVLSYPTTVQPLSEDIEARAKNLEKFEDLKASISRTGFQHMAIEAYSFSAMQQLLQDIIGRNPDVIVFDVTCMTKVHTLALAATLAIQPVNVRWVIAYSIPENYGTLESRRRWSGWRDLIVVPLAESATLSNEGHGRGIIIPGHEADRLVVALAEVEPPGGVILMMETPARPDLRQVSVQHNRKIIRQLRSMRSSDWSERTISVEQYILLRGCIAGQISAAAKFEAPLILFPFGAKSFIFVAGFVLALEYPQGSWFVYPIPSTYDVNYSEGIDRIVWLSRESL